LTKGVRATAGQRDSIFGFQQRPGHCLTDPGSAAGDDCDALALVHGRDRVTRELRAVAFGSSNCEKPPRSGPPAATPATSAAEPGERADGMPREISAHERAICGGEPAGDRKQLTPL